MPLSDGISSIPFKQGMKSYRKDAFFVILKITHYIYVISTPCFILCYHVLFGKGVTVPCKVHRQSYETGLEEL